MTASEVKQYIKGIHDLPTLPALLGKIVSTVSDETASQQDIYRLISHDHTLAEKILRVANSALFGHSGLINDIEQAMLLLGNDRIKSIALGMTVMGLFPGHSEFNIKNLWVHSYEVAFLASVISDIVPMTCPRESFLSGLLHDIGRIIFFKMAPRDFLKISTTDDMLDRERELFGCTHAEAGAWFTLETNMPPEIISTLMFHHNPLKAEDYKDAVSVVALAEALSRRFSPRIEDDGIWTGEHDALLLEYSLTEDNMSIISDKFSEVKKDIESFF